MADKVSDSAADLIEQMTPKVGGLRGIIRNYTIPITASYTRHHFARPALVVASTAAIGVSAGNLLWAPELEPTSDAEADQGPYAFICASGWWYLKHSGSGTLVFRVTDGGGAGNASATAAAVGASGMNLQQISGTVQTALNLTARFVPVTWSAQVAAITVNAADTAVFAANTSRRAMSFYNASTAGQVIALTTTDPATAVNGFLVLAAGTGYVFNPLDCPTTAKVQAYGSAAGGSLIAREGT